MDKPHLLKHYVYGEYAAQMKIILKTEIIYVINS